MNKKYKNEKLTVYSTNPNFEYDSSSQENDTLTPQNQNLEVWIDKHRAGKIAIIIKGFICVNNKKIIISLIGKLNIFKFWKAQPINKLANTNEIIIKYIKFDCFIL